MINWIKCVFLELPAEYSHDENFFINNRDKDDNDDDDEDEYVDIDEGEYDDDDDEEEEGGGFLFLEWVSMMKKI